MGRDEIGIKKVPLGPFDKGYFPNKAFDDIPDGGSADCKHVIWYRSALRKMFGMDRINSAQAATLRGNGMHYLNVNGQAVRSAVFGSKFYEDVAGVWTDRTGAVTITDGANNLVQAIDHQEGANKYAIYVNGVDAPWKWTGAGNNAAILGGSPPANFSSIAKFHQTIFGSDKENNYFSDTGDPETWNASKWVIPFDKDIKSQHAHGQTLAVLMEDHIGSISGFDYLDFSKQESEIATVGCVGRLASCKAYFGKSDTKVIATVSRDGVYLIDEGYGTEKIIGPEYFSQFNQTNISKSICAYSRVDGFLYIALPNSAATEMDYLIVVDMVSGALWPCPSTHTNNIRSMASMLDDSKNEFVYFSDTNGYAFKFNRDTINYHTGTATQAIDARFRTKNYDLQNVHLLRDLIILAAVSGNWNLNVGAIFGLSNDDGTLGVVNLDDDSSHLIGIGFIMGLSTLGGSSYILKSVSGISGIGRFMALVFYNTDLSESFNLRSAEVQLSDRRMGGADK